MSKKPSKNLTIRNSTAEFLIFSSQAGEDSIEVRYQDETIWLTQKLMAELFSVDRSVITKHLQNIFNDNELDQNSVCASFAHTAADGKSYNTQFYNLDAIISVGYRVNSKRATQFRQWATQVLRELESLGRIVNAYIDLAEDRAQRKIPMTMEDWSKRLDIFLEAFDRQILQDSGRVSAEIAKTHAESEFEKYRVVQDRLFESDFDRETKRLEQQLSRKDGDERDE